MAVMAATGGLMFLFLWPFVSHGEWPQFGEVAYHQVPMREWVGWLLNGETIGWDHGSFNGYPTYQFYFPASVFVWMTLDVVLPSHTAFMVMTVLPIPGMAWAVYWLARTWQMRRESAMILGVLTVLTLAGLDQFGFWYYGAVHILYSLFSYAWGIVWAVCFLAAVNRLCFTGTGKPWAWGTAAAGFLSLSVLSHALVGVLAGVSVMVFAGRRTYKRVVAVGAAAVGVTAWWWVPAVTQMWLASHREHHAVPWGQVFNWHVLVLLPFAVWGAVRLKRTVPHPRMLLPLVVLMAVPIAHRAIIGDGDRFHVGGRTLIFWYIAVPVLGLWALLDWVREKTPKGWWLTACVCITVVLLFPLVISLRPYHADFYHWKRFGEQRIDNQRPLPDCPSLVPFRDQRPSTFLSEFAVGWWSPDEGCLLWVMSGSITAAFGEQHRNTYGLLGESTQTRRFAEVATQHTGAWVWDLRPYRAVFEQTPIQLDRAAAQMMTLGVDFYHTREGTPPPDSPWFEDIPMGGMTIWEVSNPPGSWPTLWTGDQVPHGEWLERTLEMFSEWTHPDDVTILIRGDPPAGWENTPLQTVRPDWSDNTRVVFDAPYPGLYYVPVSFHPNWTTGTRAGDHWLAGPNQMVVFAAAPGRVELVFKSSGWQTAGAIVTLGSLLILVMLLAWKHRPVGGAFLCHPRWPFNWQDRGSGSGR